MIYNLNVMKLKGFPILLSMCASMVVILTTGCVLPTDETGTGTGTGGGQSETTYTGNFYDAVGNLEGQALRNKLKSIDQPSNKQYSFERDEIADESIEDSSKIICLYTRHLIPKNNHVSSGYAWDKWNREHIWPQGSYSQSKTDAHNYFACEGEINNIRNNYGFAEVSHASELKVCGGHSTGCYKVGNKFEPNNEAKGEVARALMYGAVVYQYNLPAMIEYSVCLKWHNEHPVTQREINRNNKIYNFQHNRNPFVDHPEYANKIWGSMI